MPRCLWGSAFGYESAEPVLAGINAASWQKALYENPATERV